MYENENDKQYYIKYKIQGLEPQFAGPYSADAVLSQAMDIRGYEGVEYVHVTTDTEDDL